MRIPNGNGKTVPGRQSDPSQPNYPGKKSSVCRWSAGLAAAAVLFGFGSQVKAQNPILPHIYAADPSAHVWPNDPNTLWLYTSHDVPGTNNHQSMNGYHVFSTQDLVNWVDHGRVLGVENVAWAISHAWAIDAVFWKGKYYLVYCMVERETGMFRTGLAASDRPQGPFTDIGFIKGVEWGQDPALFVDDDNTPYLFWGSGGNAYGVRLSDDLMSAIPGTTVKLTQQLTDVFEGPWVHKYNGTYYLSYPGLPGGKWPEEMYYATAQSPLGPYTTQGKYIGSFALQSGTNHGSFVKFKDRWIAFYHSAWGSAGKSEVRSVMADFVTYDNKGKISPVIPSKNGISNGVPPRVTIRLEAENGPAAGGRLDDTRVETAHSGYSGSGYVTGFRTSHAYVRVLAQTAGKSSYRLRIRYRAEADTPIWLLLNETRLNGDNETYKTVALPKSDTFVTYEVGLATLSAGDNLLSLGSKDPAHDTLAVDAIELVYEPHPLN
ncbi:family 43 glycosylhydrolase [Asticcacaulis sp. AC402]|uniref:family 43 glycosylhydrolase n=1 Tax=Asticcacaulis sp. AC402 TaxID=1282361 RepID=UPI00042780D4|nr:family 43 glycosylhydrolase [Asticcacaulis sp. AC402]